MGGLFVDNIDHSVIVRKENNAMIAHNGAPDLSCQDDGKKL